MVIKLVEKGFIIIEVIMQFTFFARAYEVWNEKGEGTRSPALFMHRMIEVQTLFVIIRFHDDSV